jgi:hypothetical protein
VFASFGLLNPNRRIPATITNTIFINEVLYMLRLACKQRKIDQLARVFSLELARAQFDANAILPDTYYTCTTMDAAAMQTTFTRLGCSLAAARAIASR